ncbi:acyltransferase family protein [Lactiplantibacillus daowaiensis]|uniref:Acyltransferase family protein n=1 Tax=Lactiplantibacillus daowaiensis TaxID=2559918 RepID=A0ABW1RZJ4_9LACO|nr:acyltransferase family protein [Lactiplantibacillus daowaiensis]
MKVAACTAVMLQTVLAFTLSCHPTVAMQHEIGILYNFVKFTAPAFIFGILYTTMRTTWQQPPTYRHYLRQQWSALFVPTIGWTMLYLVTMPQLQQGTPFHNLWTFCWQFINGNAAPHLWYNTMMLQFILLMPIFWWLMRRVNQTHHQTSLLTLTVIGYAGWLGIYAWAVPRGWALLDRVALSFGLYGILGAIAGSNPITTTRIKRWHGGLIITFIGSFLWTNWQLWQTGTPVTLSHASYYQPSMTLYALAVIGLIAWFGSHYLAQPTAFLIVIHWLATYAYRAYLANVFWLQLVWWLLAPKFAQQPGALIILSYGLTWLLAFVSAFGLHWIWIKAKHTWQIR